MSSTLRWIIGIGSIILISVVFIVLSNLFDPTNRKD